MTISVGDRVTHAFVVDEAEMAAFQLLSGDTSRIHTDEAYARGRGFDGVIVYGGIMLAKLSHVVGMQMPGPNGVSMSWQIDYRKPLYVGQPAEIALEVASVSPATGVIEGRFKITSGGKTLATGRTQSLAPLDEVGGGS